MLVVDDVAASSAWYQRLLGYASGHGGEHFDMLLGEGGELELMLHHRGFGAHPGLTDPLDGTPGRGVLLYVRTADARAVHARALDMGADVLDEPHENPNSRTLEFTVRDPDGYAVSVTQRIKDA